MVGWGFMEALAEAGLPPGVVNFLPGPGSEVGDTLVDHPSTRFINFTGIQGSRAAESPSDPPIVGEGQRWLKRAYMEMGGKDALDGR